MDFGWGWSTAVPPTAVASVAWCKAHVASWSDPLAPNDWVTTQTCIPKDSQDTAAMFEQIRATFDHMLVLGAWDLHFNFPALAVTPP